MGVTNCPADSGASLGKGIASREQGAQEESQLE